MLAERHHWLENPLTSPNGAGESAVSVPTFAVHIGVLGASLRKPCRCPLWAMSKNCLFTLSYGSKHHASAASSGNCTVRYLDKGQAGTARIRRQPERWMVCNRSLRLSTRNVQLV